MTVSMGKKTLGMKTRRGKRKKGKSVKKINLFTPEKEETILLRKYSIWALASKANDILI